MCVVYYIDFRNLFHFCFYFGRFYEGKETSGFIVTIKYIMDVLRYL